MFQSVHGSLGTVLTNKSILEMCVIQFENLTPHLLSKVRICKTILLVLFGVKIGFLF
jgi:hypothetical protein